MASLFSCCCGLSGFGEELYKYVEGLLSLQCLLSGLTYTDVEYLKPLPSDALYLLLQGLGQPPCCTAVHLPQETGRGDCSLFHALLRHHGPMCYTVLRC